MKNNINNIDYKNLGYIKKYISEAGKLIPSRVSGLNASEQRKMNKAIKIAVSDKNIDLGPLAINCSSL